jgi:hypothetical protein
MPSQDEICRRFNSPFVPCAMDEKLGVALSTLHLQPLNALRHTQDPGTCGWFVWGGELLSSDDEFFQPLHVQHLAEHAPSLLPYLALAPGWRVLLAPGHEDVWFDSSLLEG